MLALKYGHSKVSIELPEQIAWHTLEKKSVETGIESKIIHSEICQLIALLKQRVSKHAKILLIVPDHTRKCRLDLILPFLTERLKAELSANISILLANGSHVQQSQDVVKGIVTPDIFNSFSVSQHDAKNQNEIEFFGRTERGTDIYLNKAVRKADFVITIGAVLYHYFAGFGGGAKMLMPGVAAYETIRQNHSLTIDQENACFHPQCQEGNVESNPLHQDLSTVLSLVPNCLSLQMVLLPNGNIYKIKAGEIQSVQAELITFLQSLYLLELPEKRDVVIASAGGFPADVNLIQSHKSIHHAFQAVKENGTVIIFAECAEGIGSKTFEPYLGAQNSKEIAEKLVNAYAINGQTALSLREKCEKAKIILVSQLDDEIVRQTGIIPALNWQQAWEIAEQFYPQSGYVLENASVWVPKLCSMT